MAESVIFTRGKAIIGAYGWVGGLYRVLLAGPGLAPKDTMRFVSDVAQHELDGGGYERKDLTGRTVTWDDALKTANYMADAVVWSKLHSRQSYRWIVVYRDEVENDGASSLIVALDVSDGTNHTKSFIDVREHRVRWSGQAPGGRVFTVR